MIETLFGGLLGGIFRIAPEVLKWFDRRGERSHELEMMKIEIEMARIRGEISMRETEAAMNTSELSAMAEALKEQGETARASGKFISAISALVRPLVTYWFVTLYSVVKILSMWLAIEQGEYWKQVIISSWTEADMGMLMLVLTFWFVGRVWEREKR